jgi:predicted RNA-binding protein with PIN domain
MNLCDKFRNAQYDIDLIIEQMNNFDFGASRKSLVALKQTLESIECSLVAEQLEVRSKKKKRKRP